jgi:ADP-heptose:LPS heptosyltransferase
MVRVSPQGFLIARKSALGDVMLTLSVVAAIRAHYPSLPILFASDKPLLPLLRAQPFISEAVVYPDYANLSLFYRTLRDWHIDTLLDLQAKWGHRLWWWGYPFRYRKHVRLRGAWGSIAHRLWGHRYHSTCWNTTALHRGGEDLLGHCLLPCPLQLTLPEAMYSESKRLPLGFPYVLIVPGAQWATKRWLVSGFAEIARRCLRAGYHVVLTGTQSESLVLQGIVSLLQAKERAKCHVFPGNLSILELVGIVAEACVVLANDTGPMHIARALRRPTVALFGSTDPNQFDFTGHTVLYRSLACSPCSLYGRASCPKLHFDCMRLLLVDQVWDAVQKSFSKKNIPLVWG